MGRGRGTPPPLPPLNSTRLVLSPSFICLNLSVFEGQWGVGEGHPPPPCFTIKSLYPVSILYKQVWLLFLQRRPFLYFVIAIFISSLSVWRGGGAAFTFFLTLSLYHTVLKCTARWSVFLPAQCVYFTHQCFFAFQSSNLLNILFVSYSKESILMWSTCVFLPAQCVYFTHQHIFLHFSHLIFLTLSLYHTVRKAFQCDILPCSCLLSYSNCKGTVPWDPFAFFSAFQSSFGPSIP